MHDIRIHEINNTEQGADKRTQLMLIKTKAVSILFCVSTDNMVTS